MIALLRTLINWTRALSPMIKVPLKIGLLLGALAVIPVPDWASSIPSKLAGLPDTVHYLLYMTQLGFGLVCLAGAYTMSAAFSIVSGAIKGS